MGWWEITYWKEDSKGNRIDLEDADLEHIAEMIKEGYMSGEVVDNDETEDEYHAKKKAEEKDE